MTKEMIDVLKKYIKLNYIRKIKPYLIKVKILWKSCGLKQKLIRCFVKKSQGYSSYSVVSACYNVDKYIDEFIESVVNQTLSFQNNIQLILVDDGSTDLTLEKIKVWAARYPSNIVVVSKNNGGQASARNLGLSYVSNEWVCFADPDDFLDCQAFQRIDNCLETRKSNICMVCMNLIFYYEDRCKFSNRHPLSYKFKAAETYRSVKDLGDFFQLSASSAIVKADKVRELNLQFDERCKPNFEDARFINTYLSSFSRELVVFLRRSRYFYRKREDNSSTIDNSWSKAEKFSTVLQYGYLALLKHCSKAYKTVPSFVINAIIYDLYWYWRYLINQPTRGLFLTDDQRQFFWKSLSEIFSYIPEQSIMKFDRVGFWFYYKVGVLGLMKQKLPDYQMAYIEKYDFVKNEVQLRYFTSKLETERIYLNNKEILPRISKTSQATILDRTFLYERIFWIPLQGESDDSLLRLVFNNRYTKVRVGKNVYEYPSVRVIRSCFHNPETRDNSNSLYNRCLLISDRDVQADDNGEHLYRYLMKNYPDVNAYFLLNRDSHDWDRLCADGFKLIGYGSIEHRQALNSCRAIISSHADDYVLNYFGEHSEQKIPIVFLQHGITQADLSGWLNRKKFSLFITSTRAETNSISGEMSRYSYTQKEVVCTGFPRHDRLLQINKPEKIILVMPTWRQNLMGSVISGNKRNINPEFMHSQYAQAWKSFLSSDKLKQMTEEYGYRVVFFPHSNIQPYLREFNLPRYVDILCHRDTRIQNLFASAAVMITDYSSVAFEMAYLNKPVLYYQFDKKDVIDNHTHIYSKGYFSYEEDGFGEVVEDEENLLRFLEGYLQKACKVKTLYQERINKTFVHRDGKNCERVWQAISELIQFESINSNKF